MIIEFLKRFYIYLYILKVFFVMMIKVQVILCFVEMSILYIFNCKKNKNKVDISIRIVRQVKGLESLKINLKVCENVLYEEMLCQNSKENLII